MESGFIFGGKPYNALGSNDANNVFDSSNVVANRDGSLLERSEEIIQDVKTLLGQGSLRFVQSPAPTVDEDGGRYYFSISVIDLDEGAIAAASIDIASATTTLEKSTGGGAWSNVGVTQPTLAKADGLVEVDADLVAAEWAVGHAYRLTVSGVTVTVDGTTNHLPAFKWVGQVNEASDVKTTVDDIDTDLGEPADTNASATLHGRLAVPDADAVTNTHMRDVVGNKTDTQARRPVTNASTIAYLKALLDATGYGTDGEADAGSTSSTLVDAALTQGTADYWVGALLVMTSGNNVGLARVVTDFDPATDTITVSPAFPSAIQANDSYTLLPRHGLVVPAADSTSNALSSDVVGNKSDGAVETTGATASLMAYMKGMLDNLGRWIGPSSSTHTHTAGTTEQDVFEVAGITTPTFVVATLDLVNLTQSTTIRVYEKIDSTNYREVDKRSWTTSDSDGVPIEFTAQRDYKVTIQSGTTEGADRSVPYRHSRRETA